MRAFELVALTGVVLGAIACAPAPDADDETDDEGALSSFHGKRIGAFDHTLPDVDAIGYDAEILVDGRNPGAEHFGATVTGTYVATRALTALELDFDGNDVERITVDGRAATFSRSGTTLRIELGREIPIGQAFTAAVKYHGNVFQADGKDRDDYAGFGGLMVARQSRAERTLYASLNWPQKARRWLPLRDHPRDGAMFALKATFPNQMTVVSNGKRVSEKDNRDGSKTWSYEALTPMPTYDFFVAASDAWKETVGTASGSRVEVHSYAYAQDEPMAGPIFGDTPSAMDFYANVFGPYQWGDRVSYFEIPIYAGGIENATVIGMDETLFDSTAAAEARQVAFHEMAHHWSGNLVRYGTWNDFWLSEGFTEYLTRRAIQAHDGPDAVREVWRRTMRDGLIGERDALHAVRPPDPEKDVLTFFDDVVYAKGAFVLKMLEDRVGTDRFTKFLRSWFDKHAFGHVTTADFERELTEAVGSDVSRFFQQWIYGEYHPELKISWTRVDAGNVDLTVEQTQTKGPQEGFELPYELDVTVRGQKQRVKLDLSGRSTTKRLTITSDPQTITPDPDEHAYAVTACSSATRCKDGYHCESSFCMPQYATDRHARP
jgi:aminopeptidase N